MKPKISIIILIILITVIASYAYLSKVPYGLEVSYFGDQTWTGEPVKKKITPQVAFELTDFKKELLTLDIFSAIWKGYLYAPRDGDYKFYLTSDDGSLLFIDGKLVVDNGGFHVPVEKEEIVSLKKGIHEIEIKYFQGGGDAVLKFSWKKRPTSKKRIVSSGYLFHEKIILSDIHKINFIRIIFFVFLLMLILAALIYLYLIIKFLHKRDFFKKIEYIEIFAFLLIAFFAILYFSYYSPYCGASDSYGYVSEAYRFLSGSLYKEETMLKELGLDKSYNGFFLPLGYRPSMDMTGTVPTYPPGLPLIMALFALFLEKKVLFLLVHCWGRLV